MNLHKNARLTPQGRGLLVQRIRIEGWRVADAAAAAGLSERQAFRWLARHRAGGELALQDRSSAPARCPHRTDPDTVLSIERLRRQRRTGPQIACQLDLPRSTVGAVLRRLGLGRLSALDVKPPVVRYERDMPGELIHLDIKKLGRIDGIGHRITGDRTGQSNKRGTGWEYLHVAIDDACRLAYSEVLPSERKQCAIAFTRRALAWFTSFGVSVERIMTDNGSAYKSFAFRDLLAAWHPPQTNTTLHATHQRQGRALHPNQLARMGLRPGLLYLRRPHRRTDTLAEILQHGTHPQRHPTSNALHQTEQPSSINI